MDRGKSIDARGNSLLDAVTMFNNSIMINNNVPNPENVEMNSEFAPANINPPAEREIRANRVSSGFDLVPFEPNMITVNASTLTEFPLITGDLLINNQNNGIAMMEEPIMLNQEAQVDVLINNAEVNNNNNNNINVGNSLPHPHHSGTLLCPALSEAVQYQNYPSAGSSQGTYGELLRSIGYNWPTDKGTFSGYQNLVPFKPSNGINIPSNPMMTPAATFINSTLPPITWAGASSSTGPQFGQSEPRRSPIILELIESFRQHQYGFNNIPNNTNNHAPERLPMPGYGESSRQMLQNLLTNSDFLSNNNNLQQNTLAQSSIITSAGLNLSNMSFTQLLSANDLMTSPLAEFWIKQQLTDTYQGHILSNQFRPMPNANLYYTPDGSMNSTLSYASSSSSSGYQANYQPVNNYQAPVPPLPRGPLLVPNQPPQNARAHEHIRVRENNNYHQELESALNNVTRPVPRRRRTAVYRPALLARPRPRGRARAPARARAPPAPPRRVVVSAASNNNNNNNNNNGANSSGANNIQNSQTVIQARQQNQNNGVVIRDSVNSGGIAADEIPVKFRAVARRQETIVESSASSSKRARDGKKIVKSENSTAPPTSKEIEKALANNTNVVVESEENSNDVDAYSIASSNHSDEPSISNGVYDPEFERVGLPVDPFLRMFVQSDWKVKDDGKKKDKDEVV